MKEKKNYKKKIEALESSMLLKELSHNKIMSFLDHMQEEVWPKRTCTTSTYGINHKFYFITSGRLKTYKIDPESGREFTLFILKKNDAFDVLCLLDGLVHEVHYETLDRVSTLSVPITLMRQWIKDHPELNKNILPYLSHRMRSLEEYAANVTLVDISTRLAKLILNNINSSSSELELINDLSNEEMANLIGSTRAVVNRHLQDFKNEGIIFLGRQKVEIRNLELLLEKANVHKKENI